MEKKVINKKNFKNLFSQLYFLNLKRSGITFKDFKSGGNKELYENFFIHLNTLASELHTLKIANNRVQRSRFYTCIRTAVSNTLDSTSFKNDYSLAT